jgi:hypothetical protein
MVAGSQRRHTCFGAGQQGGGSAGIGEKGFIDDGRGQIVK